MDDRVSGRSASAGQGVDRGEADPTLRALLASAADSDQGYLRAVAALCGAQLLLPIVPVDVDGASGGDPAQLRTMLLSTANGRSAIPVFTGIDTLTAWKPDARPLVCRLDEVAATAVEAGAAAVLVDFQGPSGLVMEAALFTELAAGRRLVALDDGGWAWLSAAASDPGAEPDSSGERASG